MDRKTPTIVMTVLAFAVVLLFAWDLLLRSKTEKTAEELTRLRDSLSVLETRLDSLRTQMPGLGEYMSSIQLHAAKLWYAGLASNWPLAKYELDELEETIDAAETLHAVKNSVAITPVLLSVRQTQLPLVEQTIAARNVRRFDTAYDQTLAACNGCHKAAGYEFIHVVRPTREPVTNQQWDYVKGSR